MIAAKLWDPDTLPTFVSHHFTWCNCKWCYYTNTYIVTVRVEGLMIHHTYNERTLFLSDRTALVWPFINLGITNGIHELYLDNNTLIKHKWYTLLPDSISKSSKLNFDQAFDEQWVSNPEFSSAAQRRINELLGPFRSYDVNIDAAYPEKKASQLARNSVIIHKSWMTSYLYVLLLYRIFKAKKGDTKPRELLETLKNKRVPRFGSLVSLCTVACYLKDNQNVRMRNDDKKAYSYVQDFVSPKLSAKNEGEGDVAYLRNRAGDCHLWLLPLKLGAIADKERDNKAEAQGKDRLDIAIDDTFTKMVLVTKDKALHSFVFKCFPFVYSEDRLKGRFDKESFESEHSERIQTLIATNTDWRDFEALEPTIDSEEQFASQKRLFQHVTDGADASLIKEAERVWNEWLEPGFKCIT